jgi:Na+/H+ antiporter NhaC
MDMFQSFEFMFWAVFMLSIIFMVVFLVVFIFGILKGKKIPEQTTSENQPIIKEKEIIREKVKIRCLYCGNLCDEKLDNCPNCGGKKP